MNSKTLRSLSLSAIALSRQFGVRITVEQLEKKISQGQIKSEKELKNTLKEPVSYTHLTLPTSPKV